LLAISPAILTVLTPISTPTVGIVLPIPTLWLFGRKTKVFGAISNDVTIPPDLCVVNPRYLVTVSVGSWTLFAANIDTVAIPRPSVTNPVTVTPGPTKFNCVIEFAAPTIVPSSLTVIPLSTTPAGKVIQYLFPGSVSTETRIY
jgi:hypothetical protein